MATNKHIGYNVFPTTDNRSSMAAALAGKLLHARNESLNESMSDFEGSSNKLEFVKSIEGVDFVNDSRSTNINAHDPSGGFGHAFYGKPYGIDVGGA